MSNEHRGEVSLQMGDAVYTLRLNCNALVAMEGALQQKLPQIVAAFNVRDVGLTEIRAMLWAALRDKHPMVTLEAAGELLDVGGFQTVADAIGRAFVLSWASANGKVRDASDPKEGVSGTGTSFSRKRRKRGSPPTDSGATPLAS
jgi:hypothetical protein